MLTKLRQVSSWQWIMVSATIAIGFFMMLASHAQARVSGFDIDHGGAQPAATTLSHCGWLELADRPYLERERNVRIIQSKLENLGYSVGPAGIDGRYGKMTGKAVKTFQSEHNLAADGKVTGQTVSLLAYLTHPFANVRRCRVPYAMN